MKELDKKINETFSFETKASYKKEFWDSFDQEFKQKSQHSLLFSKLSKIYIPGFIGALAIVMFTSLYLIKNQKDSYQRDQNITTEFLDSFEKKLEADEAYYDQMFT